MSGADAAENRGDRLTVYQPRTYRTQVRKKGLAAFQVVARETDLHIQADTLLETAALDSILRHRGVLENYISLHPGFATTLIPWPDGTPMPSPVREMVAAARIAGVGPMAAVAGAMAEAVGRDLLDLSSEVIVENGGDIFLKTRDPVTAGIYAGISTLSLRVGIRVGGGDVPLGVCTSSGTVGPSLSFGKADAVCMVSSSCALADAAASAVGNRVQGAADIRAGIEFGKTIPGISGILIIVGEKLGAWGELEVVPLPGKKG